MKPADAERGAHFPPQDDDASANRMHAPKALAPLVSLLFPLCCGYIFAGLNAQLANFSAGFALAGAALLLASFQMRCVNSKKRALAVFVKALTFAGIFSTAAAYFYERAPEDPYPAFTPCEAQITAEAVSITVNDSLNAYGLAKVEKASEDLQALEGSQIWISTYRPKKAKAEEMPAFTRSQVFKLGGVLRKIEPDENVFDRYLRDRGVFYKLSANVADLETEGEPEAYYKFFARLNGYVSAKLSVFPADFMGETQSAKSYRAMLLGDKSLLTKELKSLYSATGIMHIFAVSGLHVGIVALSAYFILGLLRVPWRLHPLFSLPLLFTYVNICGAPPSAMRAFIMIATAWLAVALMRKPRGFAALVLAACLCLIAEPSYVFDAGFTLSYCVVAAILLYAVPLYSLASNKLEPYKLVPENSKTFLMRLVKKCWLFLLGGVLISHAATLASAPLTSYYFGVCAPFAAIYSFVYVAGAGVAVCCGAAACLLPDFLSQFPNALALLCVSGMELLAPEVADTLPSLNFRIGSFALAAASEFALFALVIRLLRSGKLGAAFWLLPPLTPVCAFLIAAMAQMR